MKILTGILITGTAFCLALSVPLMSGCSKARAKERDFDTGINTTSVGGGFQWIRLSTIEHDGHLFVTADKTEAISIIHHPDCSKCKNK